MISALTSAQVPVAQRIEKVSGIRPVTLLIASGIALIIGILMTTGIAADHLRRQALATTEGELGRIGTLLAAAENRTLKAADPRLADIADALRQLNIADAEALRRAVAAPRVEAALQAATADGTNLEAVAVVAADGTVLARAGAQSADLPERMPFAAGRLGSPLRGGQSGVLGIPLVHPIEGPQATPVGAVIGLVPVDAIAGLFAAVPLAADGTIALLDARGAVLASYPPASAAPPVNNHDLSGLLADKTATMISHVRSNAGWRIEALHAVADYPAVVAVSRDADRALAEWLRQGIWFAAFALAGSLAIGIMVYLIARQFQAHGALEEARAETIEAERARLAAEAELLKAERLSVLGQLTATVAHELRNPLSAIRNTLFTVKELATAGGVKLDRPVARMERSIERCDRIISDLLEYTRTRELKRDSVNFDRWLGDVLAELTPAAGVALTSELAAEERTASIDSDRLRRVVINLVDNAMQAMGDLPPDREKRVTVRTRSEGDEVVLEVEDTGPGIAPENLGRIFEPLFSTKSFGTGLGLPTVKQIVNQHDGIIDIGSELGRGATVTVRLPLEAETARDVRAAA